MTAGVNEKDNSNKVKTLDPDKVVYTVDCGSWNTYKSLSGFVYQPDREFSENTRTADYRESEETRNINIKYTNDQNVYLTERHADWTFFYEIPLDKPGVYVLILKFAEMYFDESNHRIFNILFGDTTVVQGLDIFAKAGKYAAYDEYIEFELNNDVVFFRGQPCSNAYKFLSKRLVVGFEKTEYDNPKVDGILLFEGSLEETDYSHLAEMRKVWDKAIEDEKRRSDFERKQKEALKRKQKEHDIDAPLGDGEDKEPERSIGSLLLSGPGLIIMIIMFGFLIYLLAFGSEDEKKKEQQKVESSKPKKNK